MAMDKLPARQGQSESYSPTLTSRGIWTESEKVVTSWLSSQPMPAEEIAQRLRVARVTYYASVMAEDERKAWLREWARALGDIPHGFVAASFDEWTVNGTHMPSPGHIGNRARELQQQAIDRVTPPQVRVSLPEPELSEEERARRSAALSALAAELGGGRLRRIPGDKHDLERGR